MPVAEIVHNAEHISQTRSPVVSRIEFICVIISYLCGWLYFADSRELFIYFKRGVGKYLSKRFARQIDLLGLRTSIALHCVVLGISLFAFPASLESGATVMLITLCFFILYCIYALFQIAAIAAYLKVTGAYKKKLRRV